MFKKKVSLVIAAIAMAGALAWAASDTKGKPTSIAPVTMYYHGPSFSQSDVQDKANWNTTSQRCPTGTARACQVTVDNTLVSGGAFIPSVALIAPAGDPVPLSDVTDNGTSVTPIIVNKQ